MINIYITLLTILLINAIISWPIASILSLNFIVIWMISFAVSTAYLILTDTIGDL